jgi:hypothetical protein
MSTLFFAVGAHIAATLVVVAVSGSDEEASVALGLVMPWASGLVGCAMAVAQGMSTHPAPLRIASAVQGAAIVVWTIWTRAPFDAGRAAVVATVATLAGAVLATLPQSGKTNASR